MLVHNNFLEEIILFVFNQKFLIDKPKLSLNTNYVGNQYQ